LRVVGMKNDARVNLKINEPEGGMPREARERRDDIAAPVASAAAAAVGVTAAAEEMSAEDKAAASKSVDEAMEDLGL